ncbi:bola-like protein-domain-containing protein [Sordaria brevicollis]|uniref:Bola-like protein-domain-containing protein n=1 Tax=Sordaria brevicollis TaxID=83679 RepID=A0AAE0NW92_SORBR|nr:bola-like protein-domain-containing protein [Sordaria brevicollis]
MRFGKRFVRKPYSIRLFPVASIPGSRLSSKPQTLPPSFLYPDHANQDTSKITSNLQPRTLQIHNDSHLHAHHSAMRGVTSRETHFRVIISSDAFKGKMQPARHRLVYGLLKEEMAKEGGIHALQLRTMTLEEEDKRREKEEQEEKARTCKD